MTCYHSPLSREFAIVDGEMTWRCGECGAVKDPHGQGFL